jgi:hypothetical protein
MAVVDMVWLLHNLAVGLLAVGIVALVLAANVHWPARHTG